MDLNKVMIIGNLTRDPEVRTTPQGTAVATFSVATNLRWTNAQGERKEQAEFHNIVAWRKLADIAGQYLKRGMKLYIEGRLQTRSWDDAQGQKKYRTEVVADNIIMLDRISGNRNGNNYTNNAHPTEPAIPTSIPEEPAEPIINIDEIPF